MGLGRLLRREENVSDLLAWLIEEDPDPLRGLLGLGAGALTARREALHLWGQDESSRLDLEVRVDGAAAALVELKLAAGSHGAQFSAYEHWRDTHALPPQSCHLVTLAGETVPGTPAGWRTDLTIPALFRAWHCESRQPHLRWLAGQLWRRTRALAEEFEEPLGQAADPTVAALVVKQLVGELAPAFPAAGFNEPTPARGGANLLAWVPLPGHAAEQDVCLCLELRVGQRDDPAQPWRLRLSALVEPADRLSDEQALLASHDLAVATWAGLRAPALLAALDAAGEPDLAEALLPGAHEGLRGQFSAASAAAWRAAVRDGGRPRPLWYADHGRLGGQLRVDVTDLTRHDLARLLRVALGHLVGVAAAATSPVPRTAG